MFQSQKPAIRRHIIWIIDLTAEKRVDRFYIRFVKIDFIIFLYILT